MPIMNHLLRYTSATVCTWSALLVVYMCLLWYACIAHHGAVDAMVIRELLGALGRGPLKAWPQCPLLGLTNASQDRIMLDHERTFFNHLSSFRR